MADLLSVEDLRTYFFTHGGVHRALDGFSLRVGEGEIVGLLGESGSGKSTAAWSIVNLVRPPGRIVGGRVIFRGRDLLALPEPALREIRGREISLIVSNPRAQLNPLVPVGRQIMQVYRDHHGGSEAQARAHMIEMLQAVDMPDPERRANAYPHELSGGMAQRVLIAMALICGPRLVIADDATNGLDVTVQAQTLDLMQELVRRSGTSVLMITHDLGIVAQYCQQVAVLHRGQVVETAAIDAFFRQPRHPYSRELLASVHRPAGRPAGRAPVPVASPAPPPDLAPRPIAEGG